MVIVLTRLHIDCFNCQRMYGEGRVQKYAVQWFWNGDSTCEGLNIPSSPYGVQSGNSRKRAWLTENRGTPWGRAVNIPGDA
jgi:hypothetical protein